MAKCMAFDDVLCGDGRNTVAPMKLMGSTDTSWETNRIFKRLKICMGSFVRSVGFVVQEKEDIKV